MLSFSQWVMLFTLYSILGWVCETVWCSVGARRFVNRGFMGGPWCPIYGFGGIIIVLLTSSFVQNSALVFLAAMVSTSALEYFTGWLLEALFKNRWWDYSNRKFQIRGRVCLRNSVIFGLLGLAVVYFLQPTFYGWIGHIAPTTQRVAASILVVVFFMDLLRSLAAATNLEQKLEGLQKALAEMKRYQEEQGWFAHGDIEGSLLRLREICAEKPEDEVACGILAFVDKELEKNRDSVRLVRAFPTMRPRGLGQELTALREQWAAKQKEQRHRWEKFKAAVGAQFAAAKEKTRLSYKGVTVTRMVWVFLIGSVIGYVVETVYCLICLGVIESRQGMVYGPFNQVYGFGAVLMVLLLTPFTGRGDGWLFVGGAFVGGAFEAVCSIVQEAMFGSTSWGYSDEAFSFFGGRTSLMYMFFWGILALIYMKFIYPRMARLIDSIPVRPKRFFTWVIAVFLSLNLLLSAMAVDRWSKRLADEPPQNGVEEWLDKNYPDEMLEEIYPNMDFAHAPKEGPEE